MQIKYYDLKENLVAVCMYSDEAPMKEPKQLDLFPKNPIVLRKKRVWCIKCQNFIFFDENHLEYDFVLDKIKKEFWIKYKVCRCKKGANLRAEFITYSGDNVYHLNPKQYDANFFSEFFLEDNKKNKTTNNLKRKQK